LNWF